MLYGRDGRPPGCPSLPRWAMSIPTGCCMAPVSIAPCRNSDNPGDRSSQREFPPDLA
ncbi:hypothetical protein BDY21DRAFT_339891 [Lineolata rhizophorae]|uniref:Uncharacterized protein n=1 Tax=Lineolata rhizophorae TaxID=578093 RepID=A0A6A6P5Y4_9PEZI|nr:hypothetical protein BDY21DRAFT_339891 [Lineolata rhizophorae]